MPNEPRLSELPDFIPAGVFGTPDYGKAAAVAIAKNSAAQDFVNFLARLATQTQPTPSAAPMLAEQAANHA